MEKNSYEAPEVTLVDLVVEICNATSPIREDKEVEWL